MGRGVIFLLLASLAANVFLGGFVMGRFVGKPPASIEAKSDRKLYGRGSGRFLRHAGSLSPEGRDVFRQAFDAQRSELRELRRSSFQVRRSISEQLGAEEWDRQAVEAAFQSLRDSEAARSGLQHKLLIDAIEQLSPEDRALLIEESNKRRDRRGPRGGSRDHGRHGGDRPE